MTVYTQLAICGLFIGELWIISSKLGDILKELRLLRDQNWLTTDELKKLKQLLKENKL